MPYWGKTVCSADTIDKDCEEVKLNHFVSVSATSGSISTQYFGEKFDSDKVETNFNYQVTIMSPQQNIANLTLDIIVEKNLLHGYDVIFSTYDRSGVTLNQTITSPGPGTFYALKRKIPEESLQDLRLDLMPGFRMQWNFNEAQDPCYGQYPTYVRCKVFILLHYHYATY